MKKTLLLLATAIIVAVATQPQPAHSTTQQPPAANTGAPGETTCAKSGCHASVPTQNSPSITIDFGGGLSTYQAGQTYQITIANTDSGSKYGFQMVALDNSGNTVGAFTGNNAQHTTLLTGSNGKSYISHFNATTTPVYTFQWQAPPTNVGPITFYAAANAANGNGLGTGDKIHLKTLTVDFSTAIGDAPTTQIQKNRVITYPNPAIPGSDLFVGYRLPTAQVISIEIFDISGKLIEKHDMGNQNAGEQYQNIALNPSLYGAGNYVLHVNGETYNQSRQFVVQ